jgi:hypothetical protein
MPRYKQSLGRIKIATPQKAFVYWMREELEEHMRWNPMYVVRYGRDEYSHSYKGTMLWKIILHERAIEVVSQEPVVYLRRGIKIFMGSSRMEVS